MPSEVRFAIVRKMLEQNGWQLERISGSHHIFTKPGKALVSVPVHKQRVKSAYVRKVEKLLAEEGA